MYSFQKKVFNFFRHSSIVILLYIILWNELKIIKVKIIKAYLNTTLNAFVLTKKTIKHSKMEDDEIYETLNHISSFNEDCIFRCYGKSTLNYRV